MYDVIKIANTYIKNLTLLTRIWFNCFLFLFLFEIKNGDKIMFG